MNYRFNAWRYITPRHDVIIMIIYIIGIKHVFSILHYYLMDPEGGVETRARNAKVLTTPRGLADVSVSETHV